MTIDAGRFRDVIRGKAGDIFETSEVDAEIDELALVGDFHTTFVEYDTNVDDPITAPELLGHITGDNPPSREKRCRIEQILDESPLRERFRKLEADILGLNI